MDRQTDEQINNVDTGWLANGQMGRQTYEEMHRWADRHMSKWQMDRQTRNWKYRQKGKESD
jgi:hypothetical protein